MVEPSVGAVTSFLALVHFLFDPLVRSMPLDLPITKELGLSLVG